MNSIQNFLLVDKLDFHPIRMVFLFISIVLFITSFYFTFIARVILSEPTIYHVSARVEGINVKVDESFSARWYIKKAKLLFPCPSVEQGTSSCEDKNDFGDSEKKVPHFSGSIQLHPIVNVSFTRIKNSELQIRINGHSKTQNVASLYNEEEDFEYEANEYLIVTVENPTAGDYESNSSFFNVSGELNLADTKGFPDSTITPILQEGEVNILEKTVITENNYLIGPFQLATGDSLVFNRQKEPDVGFITVDKDPGLKTVYTVTADKGEISRFKFDGYSIASRVIDRLQHDHVLGVLWALTAFIIPTVFIEIPTRNGNKSKKKNKKRNKK